MHKRTYIYTYLCACISICIYIPWRCAASPTRGRQKRGSALRISEGSRRAGRNPPPASTYSKSNIQKYIHLIKQSLYPSTSSGHLFEIQTDDPEHWQSASEKDPRSLVRPRSHGCGSDEFTAQKCPTGHNSSPCQFPGQKYPALHATQLVMAPLSSVPGPHRAGIQCSHFSLLFRTHSHATMRPTRAESSCSSSKPTSAHEPLKPCEPMPGMPEGALFHVAPARSSSLRAGQKFSKVSHPVQLLYKITTWWLFRIWFLCCAPSSSPDPGGKNWYWMQNEPQSLFFCEKWVQDAKWISLMSTYTRELTVPCPHLENLKSQCTMAQWVPILGNWQYLVHIWQISPVSVQWLNECLY
jgi:hypothetical protein